MDMRSSRLTVGQPLQGLEPAVVRELLSSAGAAGRYFKGNELMVCYWKRPGLPSSIEHDVVVGVRACDLSGNSDGVRPSERSSVER